MMQRRQFLKSVGAVSGGLVLAVNLPGCAKAPLPHGDADALQPNAFLQVDTNGKVILQLHKVEMGQGTMTGLATLVAEELAMSPADIQLEHARFHPDFRDPGFHIMLTGGSSTIRTSFIPLREAAAQMAAWLRAAGAKEWGVASESLRVAEGQVWQGDTSLSFADLVPIAQTLPVPESGELVKAEDFKYIGKYKPRVDALAKVTGKATFGIDAGPAEALSAVLVRCPHFDGDVASFDATDALTMPGVNDVFQSHRSVAVVADTYWQARQAAAKVKVTWQDGPTAALSDGSLRAERVALLDADDAKTVEEEGEETAATGERIEAIYDVPYLAHAAMEPLSAVASASDTQVEVWAGTQSPELALAAISDVTGVSRENIHLHNQLMGGAFGRRTTADYIVEAVRVAKAIGKPVRLQWSREDDTRHDLYRPNATARLAATLDNGEITSLQFKTAVPSLFTVMLPWITNALMPKWLPDGAHGKIGELAASHDPAATEGLIHSPYAVPYKRVDFALQEKSLPIGYWRSVGHSQNAFFIESFIDELAQQLKRDPLELRASLLSPDSRHARVLDAVKKQAQWGQVPDGIYEGVAVHESFGTVVAQVAHVRIDGKQIQVKKVFCAVDCGLAVNPDVVVTQMQSSIIYGLTAALKGEITLKEGAVQQSNFHDYAALRMNESPDIEVQILDSDAPPSGVGEPATPPIAPAVANAVYAATGQRLRRLPLRLS
ncbi:xanthine dehydrogenase family protein molybdopterin-binding subunit [Spongiibacter nanhainus]|uniref:Xanthine dehydrogenase family protein molybdopterin-binding subunit n=1 Tax=Spongiibacter nanhainus TaxID=2794344 RepID=A0A7T4UPU8_9GAMM|nr:molybdopterin cofactor-binding domain-containing protein [Spongiibacter nanhainus]QQD16655.1 xanthine dehydrogenase family protein molybdopterin-binding subunit [Spongiibacter nanhainus]